MSFARALALAAGALALSGGAAAGQTLAAGNGETSATIQDTKLRVFTYRPACTPRLILAVFAGL